MLKYALMILSCVFVVASMAVVMSWFLRKLKRIEQERWGSGK